MVGKMRRLRHARANVRRVKNARPHPDPLPRREGARLMCSEELDRSSRSKGLRTRRAMSEASSILVASPLLGERARVRVGQSCVWIVATLAALLFVASPLHATEVPALRPNLLFILADDLRCDAVGFMGNRVVQTPNVDRLAKR